ncbi:MAG: hypothetical protein IT488_05610 [Gammaproteobacteria bacterium]|nr:hypothetical protein [Gammaproteobacteria bacterium]
MKSILPAFISVSLLFSVSPTFVANAADKTGVDSRTRTSFDTLDKNKDGLISWSESSNGILITSERDFESADSDKDGMLSKSEYDAFVKTNKRGSEGMRNDNSPSGMN